MTAPDASKMAATAVKESRKPTSAEGVRIDQDDKDRGKMEGVAGVAAPFRAQSQRVAADHERRAQGGNTPADQGTI